MVCFSYVNLGNLFLKQNVGETTLAAGVDSDFPVIFLDKRNKNLDPWSMKKNSQKSLVFNSPY